MEYLNTGILELLKKENTLLSILNYEIDLLLSPPTVNEKTIDTLGEIMEVQQANFNDVLIKKEEGFLNMYIYFFGDGRKRIEISGKLKGKKVRWEKEYQNSRALSVDIQKARIKYVLLSSRNILRNYYLNHNLKSIASHLTAYLLFL